MKDPVMKDLDRHLAEIDRAAEREIMIDRLMEERGLDRHEAEGVLFHMEREAELERKLNNLGE